MRHPARGEVRHRARDVRTHIQRGRDAHVYGDVVVFRRASPVVPGAAPRAGAVQVRVQTPALHELLHDAQVGRRQARAEQAHHARVSQSGEHGDLTLERAERTARRPRAETRRAKRLDGDARRDASAKTRRRRVFFRDGKAILRGALGGVGVFDVRLEVACPRLSRPDASAHDAVRAPAEHVAELELAQRDRDERVGVVGGLGGLGGLGVRTRVARVAASAFDVASDVECGIESRERRRGRGGTTWLHDAVASHRGVASVASDGDRQRERSGGALWKKTKTVVAVRSHHHPVAVRRRRGRDLPGEKRRRLARGLRLGTRLTAPWPTPRVRAVTSGEERARRARQSGEDERARDDEKRGGDDRVGGVRLSRRRRDTFRRRGLERVAAAEPEKRDGVRWTRGDSRFRMNRHAPRAVQVDARDGPGRGRGAGRDADARKRELFPPGGRHRAALPEGVYEPRRLASGASGGDENGDVCGERGVARDAFALGERPSGLPRAQGRAFASLERVVVDHRQRREELSEFARLRGVLHLERAPRGAVGRLARAPSLGRAARRARTRVVRHDDAPGTAGL